jgi:hypothetical protein
LKALFINSLILLFLSRYSIFPNSNFTGAEIDMLP